MNKQTVSTDKPTTENTIILTLKVNGKTLSVFTVDASLKALLERQTKRISYETNGFEVSLEWKTKTDKRKEIESYTNTVLLPNI